MSLTEKQIDELVELYPLTTQGEWHIRDDVPFGENTIVDTRTEDNLLGAVCMTLNFCRAMSFDEGQKRCDKRSRDDAAWIAAAHNYMPALLGMLAERDAILKNPERWMKWCDIRVLEENEALRAELQQAHLRISELEKR